MPELMVMPEVLANSTEAILQTWHVKRGEPFAVGDPIASVETEKAVVEVQAEQAGVLLVVLVEDGDTVAVGTPIAVIGAAEEQNQDEATLLAAVGLSARSGVEPASSTSVPTGPTPDPTRDVAPAPDLRSTTRIFASPLARRMARERGLDLGDLHGSGPMGRIVRRDVEAAANEREIESPVPPAQTTEHQGVQYVDEPHSRVRQAVARRLTESKQQVPHFYLRATCEVDRLVAVRADLNRHATTKISLNDLVVKAAACALRDVPELNVIWTPEAVRHLQGVDVAVAIAGDRGLVTPVVRGVDRRSVSEVASCVRDLRDRADRGALRQDELEGGALTVTNLGMYGTEEFLAIINPPQAAILAVGALVEAPVVRDGQVVPATVMRVTLSVDHRPVDGVVAARWLAAFVAAVEDPVRLLV